jgi:hypothetical protein
MRIDNDAHEKIIRNTKVKDGNIDRINTGSVNSSRPMGFNKRVRPLLSLTGE